WTHHVDLRRAGCRSAYVHTGYRATVAQDGGAARKGLEILGVPDADAGDVGESLHRMLVYVLTPPAAQRAVDLHHGDALLKAQLREGKLAGEQVSLGVENLEVAVEPAAVAEIRQPHALRQRANKLLLLIPLGAQAIESHQRVGDFAQRRVNRLL